MPPEVTAYKFDNFVLDGSDEVLLCDGVPVPLTPKTFQLLKLLVENHGRVVDKQEMLDVVWADSFVEEGNVPFTVNRLRKALGDTTSQPRFLETVPRRGYRFIAPVTAVFAEEPADDLPAGTAAGAERAAAADKTRTRSLAVPLIAAFALILVASGIWLAKKGSSVPGSPLLSRPFAVQQLSTSGASANATISPDGKYVAYTEEAGGRESIWLRNLESTENIQIVPPSDDDYFGLTFSNDGRSLYFVRKPDDVHALLAVYRVETIGGIPVKVISNVTERVSLSRDDKQIAFVRCQFRKDNFCSAHVADADGRNERKLLTTENGVQIWDIRFSPDGRTLAVSKGRYSNDRNDAAVFELDLAAGSEKEMFGRRFYEIEGIEWLPDGKGVLFTGSDFRDGKASIWSVDRATGELTAVSKDAASYTKLTIDQAGDKMIAVQQVPDFKINVLKGEASQTFSVARDLGASADGRISYSTFDGEIWSMGIDGAGQRQLTKTQPAEYSVCVSPDGKAIYFSSDEGGSRQVWRMNSDGTDRRPLTNGNGGFPVSVTADGQNVFFTSALGGLLYSVPASGGEPVTVHDRLLSSPLVSPDGQLAAHFVLDKMSRGIAILNLVTKEKIISITPDEGYSIDQSLAWSADGRSLFYVSGREGKNTLWRWQMDSDAPEKVARLADGDILSISALDDGTFVYISGEWRNNVMLLHGLG